MNEKTVLLIPADKIHEVTRHNLPAQFECIWNALQGYRETCIEGQEYDEEWEDICNVMAWWGDDLGYEHLAEELAEGNSK